MTLPRPRPCNFLALAKHQRLCSSLSKLKIRLTEGETPLKPQAFLCFQIIRAPKMIRELTPFLSSFFTLLIVMCHQSAKLDSCWRRTGPERFSGANKLNQTCLPTTHEANKCCIVSFSWSQRGHLSGWGRPLLANQSAIQHLFRIANHKKNLHLFGAQDFHRRLQGSKLG